MNDRDTERRWVEDIRGPILLLARDHLAAWRGTSADPEADWPGDVSAVPGVLGIADVGDGIALMLHDDYAGGYTTWAPCDPMTVREWRDAELVARDAELEGKADLAAQLRAQRVAPAGWLVTDIAYKGDAVAAVAHVPDAAWQRIARTFRTAGGAVLFDGYWPGEEFAETGYELELAAGEYFVEAVPRFEHGDVIARYVRLLPARR